ncbi:MAG: hypothetical protein UGF45_13705 [Massilioclostridium sp.]|nr:hypothetical protein [Massilioclostridium sp.]
MKKTISRTRILAFLLSLTILAMVVPQGMVAEAVEETMSIVNLKTDGLLDPLGIDTTEPVFSWQMDSDLVGAKQAAYQVVVKDDAGKVVWDSGQVKQSESIGIRYEGEELKAATRYTWTVAVTDNSGDTVTSEPATFETGLMSTAQWDADWIGGELTMYARTMQFFDFTAELQIPEGSEKASVVLFADEFRLKNSVFNTRRLENDVNYMRYEVDLTDESSPKLNIYVVGYTDGAGDPENTPNRTIDIPAEALGADNAHDWISISIGNNRTCSINGVSVGAPTGIPSIGSRISMLGSIGFAVPANGEAVYKNMQVFQNGGRYTTRECVFGPSTGATSGSTVQMQTTWAARCSPTTTSPVNSLGLKSSFPANRSRCLTAQKMTRLTSLSPSPTARGMSWLAPPKRSVPSPTAHTSRSSTPRPPSSRAAIPSAGWDSPPKRGSTPSSTPTRSRAEQPGQMQTNRRSAG